MELISQKNLTRPALTVLPLVFSLLLAACNGGGNNDDNGDGSADTTIGVSETFNLDGGAAVLPQAKNSSHTNGAGIGKIIAANAAGLQPGNGYTASTIDIVNIATNAVVAAADFASHSLGNNPTAAQLAAFFETQSNRLDASASTTIRLTLSTSAIAAGNQFSLNGLTITGTTRSEVMASIDRLPSVTASVDTNGVITVSATDGNDLRLNLNNAASGQTIAIESLLPDTNGGSFIVGDSATIGAGLPNTKATIGGNVEVTLDYPLQLANAGVGNIFGATIPNIYTSQNAFDPTKPATYNHAGSIAITDSLGNTHTLTEYFVRQDDLGGTNPNRWNLYVLIDGKNVGNDDTNGIPTLARFDLAFDSNGQLDTVTTDPIEISQWVPLDSNGNPNNAATARITISITGSTEFGGSFALTNVSVN